MKRGFVTIILGPRMQLCAIWQNQYLSKSCFFYKEKRYGTSYKKYMKGMIRSRRRNYKSIEDNLIPLR
jgi:hypothetical protein